MTKQYEIWHDMSRGLIRVSGWDDTDPIGLSYHFREGTPDALSLLRRIVRKIRNDGYRRFNSTVSS